MKALIDGDIIVYEAGSAADYTYYSVDSIEFPLVSDARAHIEETYGIPGNTKEGREQQAPFIKFHRDPSPLQYSLGNVKQLIGSIMQGVGAQQGAVWLTSDDHSNYRYARATVKPYKGQRNPDGKPYWYKEIREYLVDHWGAEVVYGREADDALGCAQYASESRLWDSMFDIDPSTLDRTIICTKDKDLDMIPGWHYNWQTEKSYEISENEAWSNFYHQLLIGDSVDNIPGCPGVGKKNGVAVSLKSGIQVNRAEIEQTILEMYERKLGEDAPAIMLEMADLLWIQREEGKLWEPVNETLISERERQTTATMGDEAVDSEVRVASG